MMLEKEHVKVEFVDLGEGYDGDFDKENPDDEKLLRLDVYTKNDDEEFNEETKYSACTLLPVEIDVSFKVRALEYIGSKLNKLIEACKDDSIKTVCEKTSHINIEDVKRLFWKKATPNSNELFVRHADPLGLINTDVYEVIQIVKVKPQFNNEETTHRIEKYEVSLKDENALTTVEAFSDYYRSFDNPLSPESVATAIALGKETIESEYTVVNAKENLKNHLISKYHIII